MTAQPLVQPSAPDTAPRASGLRRHAAVLVAAGAAAVVGLVLAVLAARQPLPEANSWADLYYPFFWAPFGVAMTALGVVLDRRRPDSRWGWLVALLGVAWSVNALLVAARGLAATPAGSPLPQQGIAWAEDWFYMISDFGTMLGLGLVFPSGRATGAWRFVVRALAGTVGVMMVVAALCAGPLDNTGGLPNPLGIPGTAWMYSLVTGVGYPVVLLGGVLALLARVVVAVVRPGVNGRRVAGYLAGMITATAAGFVWMGMHADQSPHVWVGWIGFTLGLAAMLAIGAVGVIRSPRPAAAIAE
jgi:hypothetical protein